MITSVSNRSGGLDETLSNAFKGSVNELTLKPFLLKIQASVSEIAISSSTTKIWIDFSSDKDHPSESLSL